MRRGTWLMAILALAVLAGIVPARSAGSELLTFSFCTGDGRLQIFDNGPLADDISLFGDIGCLPEGATRSVPMHVEAIIGASTVGTAGACGGDGTEAPLEKLRMRMKMTVTYKGRTHIAIRTWAGHSTGDFPGSNIVGQVRDPAGLVNLGLGKFRLEPFATFYCAQDFSYIRLWNIVMGPSPGL
jgi:hypothetical protein